MSDHKPSKLSLLNLDPGYIWSRSPLNRDAIDRVLATRRKRRRAGAADVTAEISEAARLTLAVIADMLVLVELASRGTLEPSAGQAEKGALQEAFRGFLERFRPALTCNPPPPPPPTEWMKDMQAWLALSAAQSSTLKTSKDYERESFQNLLSFYAVFYGEKPAWSAAGPTVRFISAFYQEMNTAIAEPKLFDPPTVSTIQNRIRETLPGAMATESRNFVRHIFAELSERLAPDGLDRTRVH